MDKGAQDLLLFHTAAYEPIKISKKRLSTSPRHLKRVSSHSCITAVLLEGACRVSGPGSGRWNGGCQSKSSPGG
jgi:hypothetical protein